MNKQGNLYIFIYASVLVIVVAAILSFAAINLKPIQDKNIEIEKMQNLLTSVNISSTTESAKDLYEKYITESFLINTKGEKVEGVAFKANLKKEYSKSAEERALPLYKAVKNDTTYLIIPLRGKGLWGPIWGYLSFMEEVEIAEKTYFNVQTDENGDTLKIDTNKTFKIVGKHYNTISGATFDHKGETPGLGADINKDWFEKPFIGKKIFDENGNFISITVVKGGAVEGDMYGVDAISGGTITSKALEDMIKDCIGNYLEYIKNEK
jgi:Na+-transporting NADH:ubiquinone oxidoreductase subunit C